jgi:NitT/TauT family transport system substrate-binding protein
LAHGAERGDPHEIRSCSRKLPGAIKLVDASAFYPQSAIVGGWVAGHDFYNNNKEVLAGIIRGWAAANSFAAADALQKGHYRQASVADVTEALKAQKMLSSREWKRLYSDGTVVKWLQQVSDFFIANSAVTNAKPAKEYFDPSIYRADPLSEDPGIVRAELLCWLRTAAPGAKRTFGRLTIS